MTYRKPYLKVTGPGGEDMLRTWGSKLIGVKLIDRDGYESDEAIFIFTRKRPYPPAPALDTPFQVYAGWSADDTAITGYYTFQRLHLFGDPKAGQRMEYICRAGDFIEHLKRVDSEHFDEKTGHKTLGDVFQSLFKSTGKSIVVAPEIAKQAIPGGYSLRWNQSAIDFATDLADDHGAIVKPMGDRMVVMKRGAGESGGGKPLGQILIQFREDYSYDVELEPRFEFQKISASYLDIDKGTLEREDKSTSYKSSRDALPHPFGSKEAAAAAAASVAQEWGRFTGHGLFWMPGNPAAVANAPVKCEGFGQPIDDVDWMASSVTHDIVPNVGWTTSVETEVKAD